MSYLNSYRINFWGGISTNVCTANNDDDNSFYVDPVKAMLSPELIKMTDDDAVKKMQQNPGWNYYGDYVTAFSNAKISSFGEPNAIENTGAIVDQGIYLLGSLDPNNSSPNPIGSPIMVDMDSTGSSCTRIIVGGLQIGGTNNPLLRINENTMCYTRSLNSFSADGTPAGQGKSISAFRYGAANTSWQLSFEYDESWTYDESNPQIVALMNQAKAAKGITMVFTQFEVIGVYSGVKRLEELVAEYNKGNTPINPVLGYTIGSIGVWEEEESATCLPGRLLKVVPPKGDASPIALCDTYAQLNEESGVLSLNMASTFVKPDVRTDRDDVTTMSPTYDPKTIELAVDIDGTKSLVAPIPYDCTNYYLSGGMVDVKLNSDQIAQIKKGDLSIVQTNAGAITNTVCEEQTYRFISDDRGVYVEPNATNNLEFNITKWGQAVTEDLELDILFMNSGILSNSYKMYQEMNVGLAVADGTQIPFTAEATAGMYKGSTTIKASDASAFKLDMSWIQPGFKQINLTVKGAQNANYYMVARTYCDDDYSTIPDSEKFTWEFVYEEVLRYYYVVFPAMSSRLPLNNKELISNAVYGVIKERVSDVYKETTLLMPITRDMSPGKAKLLTDYLNFLHPSE